MKKLGAILLVVMLAVGLTLPMAMSVAASNGSYVLYGIIGGQYLVTIDETTGDTAEVAVLSGSQDSVNAIAFDSNSGTLYGLARAGGNHRPQLATIDVCTGNVTVIGQITLPGETVYFSEGLAVDPSGTIYVSMSINGDFSPGSDYYSETLATVDPDTAVATTVATITNTVQREADGLEFVGSTLYATDDPGSGPTNIYTINTGTGVATFKGTLSSPRFNNVGDMAYNPDSTLLYGFDPGAYTNGNPRYLCTISHPGMATATAIGITHTAAEFGGGLMSGIAWVSVECEEEKCADLIAGQHIDVGDVNVWNDDTNLYVQYVLDDPWVMTESHLHVATSMESIPQTQPNKKGLGGGNPIPGHFDYSDPHGPVTEYTYIIDLGDWVPCTDLVIAAHAEVIKVIGEGCESPFWATSYTSPTQGPGWNTSGDSVPVVPERSDPEETLGPPDASGPPWSGFYSLGEEGYITVSFGYPIFNGDGEYDISVHETSGNRGDPTEDADVYVIVNSAAYLAGTVRSSDQGNGIGTVSIPDEFVYVDAVKVVDTTDKSWHLLLGYAGDGYDIDAVDACYLVEQEETAWGYCEENGGEFPGKNWATYLTYHVH